MKSIRFILINVILFVLTGFLSCVSQPKSNKEEKIAEVVHHNMIIRGSHFGVETTFDSLTTYLCFDSGMRGELFLDFNMIDSLFKPGEFEGMEVPYNRDVLIDGKPTEHTRIRSMVPVYLKDEDPNFKVSGRCYNGVISPHYATDQRVWEINFEKRFVAIHEKDTVPPGSVVFPLRIESNALFITMPIKVIKGNDTLSLNQEYALDYGNFASFGFTDIENEGSDFIVRNSHVYNQYGSGSEYLLFADKIEMPDGLLPIQSEDEELIFFIRPSSNVDKVVGNKPLLGFGILRHYNAMLDLKNKRFIMWNYDYQKYGKDNHISNHFVSTSNIGFTLDDGKVNSLCDGMNAMKSGLQLKDKVLQINGTDISRITPDALDSLMIFAPVGKEIELDILRDKKPLTIKYTTDLNPIYK